MGSSVHGENTCGYRKRQFGYRTDSGSRWPRSEKFNRYEKDGSYPPKHTHEPIYPRLYILGIIMSMHLLNASGGATRTADGVLSLITSYENGSVKLWQYRNIEKERSIEGLGWECLWSFMLHVESGERSGTLMCLLWLLSSDSHICATAPTVMATAVSLDRSIALSVSADHLVGRYDLKVCAQLTRSSHMRLKKR